MHSPNALNEQLSAKSIFANYSTYNYLYLRHMNGLCDRHFSQFGHKF